MGAELIWIPETSHRSISDYEVAILANRDERIILTRDRDFMKSSLRKRARYGVIYIGEPIRKDNVHISMIPREDIRRKDRNRVRWLY